MAKIHYLKNEWGKTDRDIDREIKGIQQLIHS